MSALTVRPIASASHSPLPLTGGDHARLVISPAPVYAITGSPTTRRLAGSGRGELPWRVLAGGGALPEVYGARSHRST
jgi:hypothetical protein